MEITTVDLSKFRYRELDIASDLLKEYSKRNYDFLSDGLTLNFNANSGNVFLSDEEYNVGMLNNGKLEQWFNCGYCGHEGFKEDMLHEPEDFNCKEFMQEIGINTDEIAQVIKETIKN